MTIQHFPKSPERFKATPVVSADAAIINGTIYMTVIPTTTLVGRGTVAEQAREASVRAPFGAGPVWVTVVLGWPAILVVVVVVAMGDLATGVFALGVWARAGPAIRAAAVVASMNMRIGSAPSSGPRL